LIRAALLALLLLAAPARATDDPAADLAAAGDRVGEAARALDAATGAADPIAGLAAAIAGYEAALGGLGTVVSGAVAREQALAVEFETRRIETMRLLAALEALSRAPLPAGGLHPQGPLAGARAAAAMERLRPALDAEAAALGRRVAELDAARRLRARGEDALAGGRARLASARTALSAALAEAAPDAEPANSPALMLIARDSETLTQLAAALARAEGSTPPPAARPPGPLLWPVAGALVGGFRAPDGAGVRRPGLLVAAAPLALVRAPADAVVRYAGPFLEYGYVAVLEPDAETMIVLAGMAQIRARTGTAVRRGELVGLLGGRPPEVEESVMTGTEAGAGPVETLYIEVRNGRGPIDPEPLFAGENG
jgi:septal ring factor EnvC (AmiA/AmiB activator)